MTPKHLALRLLLALPLLPACASAADVYGGIGSTGFELGLSQSLGGSFGVRLDANTLTYTRKFTTSDIDYDAKLKFLNAGAYLDWFVVDGFRFTGGALIGNRRIHGVATGVGNTVKLNGVTYPLATTDALDFEAKFPTTTPYLGIGWGHHAQGTGFHFYADAGVAYGRPKVTLTPTATLLAKINPADLAAEQSSVQDKADDFRAYPVLKLGIVYSF